MWFLCAGALLVVLKYFEVGPVATWSWWWVLSPFGLAMAWFEIVEPLFGLDKRKVHDDVAKAKDERIKKQLNRR